tara:strand:+ start:73223 stop:73597 length:375 start_codon:yes stop_codon:yes gene_type:complete
MKLFILLAIISFSTNAKFDCFKQLCKGDRVMDQYGWNGRVESFDRDRLLVNVALSHVPSLYAFPYGDLGKGVRCFDHICLGDKVVDNTGDEGEVLEVFNHGNAWVFIPNYDGRFILETKNLTLK